MTKEEREEWEGMHQLLNRMSDILTRTANVLKGKPHPLVRHSWHDLPEVAEKLVKRVGRKRR